MSSLSKKKNTKVLKIIPLYIFKIPKLDYFLNQMMKVLSIWSKTMDPSLKNGELSSYMIMGDGPLTNFKMLKLAFFCNIIITPILMRLDR